MNTLNTNREGRFAGPFVLTGAPEAPSKKTNTAKPTTPATPKIKRTRAQIAEATESQALQDLRAAGGIVAKGSWQTGTGNYKKARATPAGAKAWAKWQAEFMDTPQAVREWFAAHPRAQNCIAITSI